MSGHEILAGLASSPADYARFGLDPTTVARWEDGARTDNRGVCCVQRDGGKRRVWRSTGHIASASWLNAVARRSGGETSSEFVVSAAEVLHEGMASGESFG